MLIRKMTETDVSEVCLIEQEIFSDPWSKEDFMSAICAPNNGYLVVVVDDKIVGYCGYWGIAGEGYIYNVAVKKEYRQQQIGYFMLQKMINDSKEEGIDSFTLEVRSSNIAAIRLYEALGFVAAGTRKDFYSKPKEDAVIMWLNTIQ